MPVTAYQAPACVDVDVLVLELVGVLVLVDELVLVRVLVDEEVRVDVLVRVSSVPK